MSLPKSVKYLIIGAGVHGLSTAYHLGKYLKEKGQGDGPAIPILRFKKNQQVIHALPNPQKTLCEVQLTPP